MTKTEAKCPTRKRIYQIIQIGYTGDTISKIFDIFITLTILLNLFVTFWSTFDSSASYSGFINAVEWITVGIFTIEYALRLWTADYLYPNEKSKARAIFCFVFSLYGIIDLVTFLPAYLPIFFPSGLVAFRILRVIRIFRLFRINKYYDAFNVITDVIEEKKNQILSAVFIILMMIMASSLIMYNLEHDAQPESFKNAFSGIWWAVSTLLTVGYGDIYPVTTAGRCVGIILAFLGVGIVAIPTGIISAGFVEQYTKVKSLSGSENEYPVSFVTVNITNTHVWGEKKVRDIQLVQGLLLIAIIRDERTLIPHGDTIIHANDRLIIGAESFEDNGDLELTEMIINKDHIWIDRKIKELDLEEGTIIVSIKRGHRVIIPNGSTVIKTNDILVLLDKMHKMM